MDKFKQNKKVNEINKRMAESQFGTTIVKDFVKQKRIQNIEARQTWLEAGNNKIWKEIIKIEESLNRIVEHQGRIIDLIEILNKRTSKVTKSFKHNND